MTKIRINIKNNDGDAFRQHIGNFLDKKLFPYPHHISMHFA